MSLRERVLALADQYTEWPGTRDNFALAVMRMTLEAAAQECEVHTGPEYKTGKVDHNERAWCDVCADAIRKLGGEG